MTNSDILSNKELFQLQNSEALGIDSDIAKWLIEKEFPWLALGKTLTAFVEQSVSKVPLDKRRLGNISPLAHIDDSSGVVICEGATVEPFAFISGPCWIGPGASVRHGAYVRGSVYACAGAVIGHTSEVKGALLLPESKAAHFAYVGDSILGVRCNLGAGTKFANLRFDHGNVQIRFGTEYIDSGLKKFGAILGNDAQTGCNSVTNPGTILLPGAMILPTANARGVVRKRG